MTKLMEQSNVKQSAAIDSHDDFGLNGAVYVYEVADANRYVYHGRREYLTHDRSAYVDSPFEQSPYYELYQKGLKINLGLAEHMKIHYESARWALQNYHRTKRELRELKVWAIRKVDLDNAKAHDTIRSINAEKQAVVSTINAEIDKVERELYEATLERYRLYVEVQARRWENAPKGRERFLDELDELPGRTQQNDESLDPEVHLNGHESKLVDRWWSFRRRQVKTENGETNNGIWKPRVPDLHRLDPEGFASEAGVTLDKGATKGWKTWGSRILTFCLALILGPFVGLALFSKLSLIQSHRLLDDISAGGNLIIWAAAVVGIAIFASAGWFVEKASREIAFQRYSDSAKTEWGWWVMAALASVGFLVVLVLDTALQHEGILLLMPRAAGEPQPTGIHWIYVIVGASIIFAYLCLKAASGIAAGREEGKLAKCQKLSDEWHRRQCQPLIEKQLQLAYLEVNDQIARAEESYSAQDDSRGSLREAVSKYAEPRARCEALHERLGRLKDKRSEIAEIYDREVETFRAQIQMRPHNELSSLEIKRQDRAHDRYTMALFQLEGTANKLAQIVDQQTGGCIWFAETNGYVEEPLKRSWWYSFTHPTRFAWWNPFSWNRRY